MYSLAYTLLWKSPVDAGHQPKKYAIWVTSNLHKERCNIKIQVHFVIQDQSIRESGTR